MSAPHRVVVVGGGFGGLQAVSRLRRGPVEITLVDRRNFHLFQPLVYQVATGVLALGEISFPLRRVFRRDRNVRVVMGEVTGFDLAAREVLVDRLPHDGGRARFGYDSLIVAAGSEYTYLGHDEWRALAPDVKSPESALDVRRRLMTAFEAAELETDDSRREAWLTFVVIGGGPTGVELAGQIGELTREMLRSEYRTIDTSAARILLVEIAPRVLPEFPPRLSQRAAEALEALGATPLVGHSVVEIDARSVVVDDGSGARVRVPARTVIWAAGVAASELAAALAAQSATDVDRHGRVAVGPGLSLAGHPEVTAIGDLARVHDADGKPLDLPGLAPVAMQQGRHAARAIEDRLRGLEPRPFRYLDKGNLATVGRGKAVARIRRLELSGLPAWITWLVVHLLYLLGVQNRLVVFVRWAFSYVVRRGGAQLITGVPAGGPPSTDTGGPTDAHDDASAGSPHRADAEHRHRRTDRCHGCVEVVREVSPAVVQIQSGEGLGSGVVYDDKGHIVTNNHVVAGADTFTVTLASGRSQRATLVGSYPPEDLAVIRLESPAAAPAEFGDSSNLTVGQFAFAIGNPLGLRSSVTEGIISSLGRTVSEGPGGAVLASAIQTSAPINPGNSGGALVDIDGDVVGIPTLAALDPKLGGAQAPGIGFAIPSNTVKRIADQLVGSGRVTDSGRAYLGVRVATSVGGEGAVVAGVQENSPADEAGLRPGELIVGVNHRPTPSADALATVLAELRPGQRVPVEVVDPDGEKRTVTVTLGELKISESGLPSQG